MRHGSWLGAVLLLGLGGCPLCGSGGGGVDGGGPATDAGEAADGGADADPAVSCSGVGVVQVARTLQGDSMCAVIDDGRVLCQGSNLYGELGRGFVSVPGSGFLGPDAVTGVADAVEVATGDGFTCVRHAGGEIRCFGRDSLGQLGNGPGGEVSAPDVAILTGATRLVAGRYAACASNAVTTWCWGYDMASNLASASSRWAPVEEVRLPDPALDLDLGEQAACGIDGDTAVCARFMGGLGPDSDIDFAPVLGAGYRHFCAARADGAVMCWGQNFDGQLGDGTTGDADGGVLVSGLTDIADVTGGWGHSCALRQDGTVWCWGDNDSGQLGRGSLSDRELAAAVPGLTGVVQLDSGYYTTCAVTAAGSLYCWGGIFPDQPGVPVDAPRCIDLRP